MDRSRCSSTPGVAATCASKTSTFAICPCGSSVRPGRRSPMDRRKRLSYHESVLMRCIFLPAVFSLLAAAQQIPRPEFPQPQFQRGHWLNLNGPWEFEFDDGNRGLAEDWAGASKSFSRHITVPFCFESARSGIGDTSFHPWAWYRRGIAIPEDRKGRRVLLHFGAVDYRAIVWINGRLAGRHEGGNTPFQFDITRLLKPGSNTLAVRAEDPPTDRYIPRGKQY